MLYLTDKFIQQPPADATHIVYLASLNYMQYWDDKPTAELYEYWTPEPGADVQMYITEKELYMSLDWKLITDDPAKYTNMVSENRFCSVL